MLAPRAWPASVPYGLLELGLRGREPGDRNAVRGAGDVVQPRLVEEPDRRRVAAVLAADADLEPWLRGASLPHPGLDELADARRVDRDERLPFDQPLLDVGQQELR